MRHGHASVLATTEAAEGSGVAWARSFYEKAGFVEEMIKDAKPISRRRS